MHESASGSVAQAAECRRRDLPISIALVLLMGGIGAAVLESSLAVGWAGVISALLIADMEIYRRLDVSETQVRGRIRGLLLAWSVACGAIFAGLPLALWLDGAPAGAAAALSLWLAGVVRPFAAGLSGDRSIAMAGAAPSALCILIAPGLIALIAAPADWDAAVIVTLGGVALTIILARALLNADSASAAARQVVADAQAHNALAALLIGQQRAILVDGAGVVLARQGIGAGGDIEDAIGWPRTSWGETLESLALGELLYRDAWEARAWRDSTGEIIGALIVERGANPINFAPRQAPKSDPIARRA